MRQKSPGTLQSAEQALRLVQLLGQRGTVTLTEVALELGVGNSTAHRLLATCRAAGFARQDHSGGPYVIGPSLHELSLGASAAVRLREASADILATVAEQLQETVCFVILEGANARVVEAINGGGSVREATPLGTVSPAHCTAGGKALLAHVPEDDLLRRFPSRLLAAATERTITQWPALLADLARTRDRGWATEIGEYDPAVSGFAACIRDATGQPRGAVAVVAPLTRLNARRSGEIAPVIVEAAARIQRRLRSAVAT